VTTATDTQPQADTRPIEDLALTVRSYNCLKNAGIDTVGQLVERSEADLMDLWSFGVGSLANVVAALAVHGLKLADGAT
jgi:DNA-directed RNA polymerase subunit alpha